MKSGKAVGPDDIPVEVWKCLGEAAVEFLASLFNRVLENLEKAYDRVPREELWYCMRKSGVTEKYVRVVQDMYERSRTVVRCAVGQTEEFSVEVGLHQGSALSPFLFAIVMDQLSEEVRQESPWTMTFADDIVICSESREQVEENLERWRFALERRGMKVSRSKTEYMCVNEREGSGTVRLQGEEVKKVQEFKYLGSTVQSYGECGKEVKKRVQAGWNGWRKVSGVLCDRKISARIKGKVYRTVVRPAMLYGLETVSLRKRQESELEVAELKMLRFSLGVTRLDRIRNEYIRGTAHVGRLGDKVREARLRWFGHVQRREMPSSFGLRAAINLIDRALVEELGIPTFPCVLALRITAIDSQPIGEGYLKHQTELLEFQVGLFHYEQLSFYVTSLPANPVILGFPWLRRHDPHISWRSGELMRWSTTCLRGCLRDPVLRPCRTSRMEKATDAAGGHLPRPYTDFWEVFSEERVARLPLHQVWDCAIDLLPNTSLPKGWIYPLSLPESKAMEEYIETSLAAGHIQPSMSPAAAGFFFVEKRDGGLWPCIDYRGLNAITVQYPYLLPLVPAELEQLRGAWVFTKLDLHSAYNLVRIREGDEWKTAFHTTHGHYKYCVMPFGLTNTPAVFQALINEVFRDLLGKGVIAYIDDILV
ncbi:hypothetical protein QTP86_001824 [Hemibagrus guttatus]|nr:hypothetical protein QTP86_001824 [Hemibagrus guttatus]